MSNQDDVLKIYKKERDYERCVFGEYANVKSLNVASFIVIIKEYLNKMEKAYSGKWNKELPSWLESSKEFEDEGSTPVEVYKNLIVVMTLAGAALEAYSKLNPEHWRENQEEDKKKWEE